jgi:nitrate/TMAO reductase-like tetraheme cytochrome c subunit
MDITLVILLICIGLGALLVGTLVARPAIAATRGGKMLAFVALFVVPVALVAGGTTAHLEHSKRTSFCLSCHIMKPYGESLKLDDSSHLAASHFVNRRIPVDEACYTCHTDYTMFGPVKAKMHGLRHVWVWLTQDPKPPIHLYKPFTNQNCLHCHAGAKSFEEGAVHNADPETMPLIKADKLSCVSSGCHDLNHDTTNLKNFKSYGGVKP